MTESNRYIYVASSWRCPTQPIVIETLKAANIPCYDFRRPSANDTGFKWTDVAGTSDTAKDGTTITKYLSMLHHPIAQHGYNRDMSAMIRADTFILVLPCGKSAHLELGWAVGQGKRTAILLEEPVEPDLMYLMVDYLAPSVPDLMTWL